MNDFKYSEEIKRRFQHPELDAMMKKAIDDLVRQQNFAIEKLTREQVSEVIHQMIASGDIQKNVVCAGPYRQSVIYLPYESDQRQRFRIEYLEGELKKLGWKEGE
jgi:hypothetical protein